MDLLIHIDKKKKQQSQTTHQKKMLSSGKIPNGSQIMYYNYLTLLLRMLLALPCFVEGRGCSGHGSG